MIRIAFTMIGGKNWTGGYNYLLNLVNTLSANASDRVQPVLFLGNDFERDSADVFERIAGVTVIRDAVFNEANTGKRLQQAIFIGLDRDAAAIFAKHSIDIVFESAQFYGWRFPIPAIAWIPDFQHRYLKHLFDFNAFWKREIGFRIQIMSGRRIMLSSEDARQDCELFYPRSRGKTHVVRFAVHAVNSLDTVTDKAVVDAYNLPKVFFFLPNQFWKHKNHYCVIEALRILKRMGREVVVAASGKQMDPRDPEHYPEIERLIEMWDLKRNFRILGLIPSAHIPALMRSCTALINPSMFEGWSTSVEEAKDMGTPMILSSLRVHREQSDDAIFFDPNSPEELADILDKFSLDDKIKFQSKKNTDTRLTSSKMKVFADEFVLVMEKTIADRLSLPLSLS